MERIRGLFTAVTKHRAFIPTVVAAIALILGTLLAFEHSRNLVKVRGPYLVVLGAILIFPVFAFRFFDPHEDSRPITGYFIVAGIYYILLGGPNLVTGFDALLRAQLTSGTIKQLAFGVTALAAIAGMIQYAIKFSDDTTLQNGRGLLTISVGKFLIYAFIHMVYINATVMLVREKFGITTVFS
jgi:hypothetical protein